MDRLGPYGFVFVVAFACFLKLAVAQVTDPTEGKASFHGTQFSSLVNAILLCLLLNYVHIQDNLHKVFPRASISVHCGGLK